MQASGCTRNPAALRRFCDTAAKTIVHSTQNRQQKTENMSGFVARQTYAFVCLCDLPGRMRKHPTITRHAEDFVNMLGCAATHRSRFTKSNCLLWYIYQRERISLIYAARACFLPSTTLYVFAIHWLCSKNLRMALSGAKRSAGCCWLLLVQLCTRLGSKTVNLSECRSPRFFHRTTYALAGAMPELHLLTALARSQKTW